MLIRVWAPAATGERGLSPAVVPWGDRVPPSGPQRCSRGPRCSHLVPGPQSRGPGTRKRGKARAKPTTAVREQYGFPFQRALLMLIRVWAPAATGERGLSPAVVPWSDRVPPSVPRRGSRSPRCAHPLPGPQSRGAGGRKRGKARAKPTISVGVHPRRPQRLFRSAIMFMLRRFWAPAATGERAITSVEKLALAQPSIWEHARVFP